MLLAIADKYDMPALLSKAADYLQSNVKHLTSSSSSIPQYVWKWIGFADRLKLGDVARACIRDLPGVVWADLVIVQLIASQPGRTELAGISVETYQLLLRMVEVQYRDGVMAKLLADQRRHEATR
jgi:hypothetical protein